MQNKQVNVFEQPHSHFYEAALDNSEKEYSVQFVPALSMTSMAKSCISTTRLGLSYQSVRLFEITLFNTFCQSYQSFIKKTADTCNADSVRNFRSPVLIMLVLHLQ